MSEYDGRLMAWFLCIGAVIILTLVLAIGIVIGSYFL
jgi:hypothetical protein